MKNEKVTDFRNQTQDRTEFRLHVCNVRDSILF